MYIIWLSLPWNCRPRQLFSHFHTWEQIKIFSLPITTTTTTDQRYLINYWQIDQSQHLSLAWDLFFLLPPSSSQFHFTTLGNDLFTLTLLSNRFWERASTINANENDQSWSIITGATSACLPWGAFSHTRITARLGAKKKGKIKLPSFYYIKSLN